MAGYNHIGWACPYFKWDAKGLVKCEAGRIVFPDREAERAHTRAHCASVEGWNRCSLAAYMTGYYERQEEECSREKRGQNQSP